MSAGGRGSRRERPEETEEERKRSEQKVAPAEHRTVLAQIVHSYNLLLMRLMLLFFRCSNHQNDQQEQVLQRASLRHAVFCSLLHHCTPMAERGYRTQPLCHSDTSHFRVYLSCCRLAGAVLAHWLRLFPDIVHIGRRPLSTILGARLSHFPLLASNSTPTSQSWPAPRLRQCRWKVLTVTNRPRAMRPL